MPKPRGRPRLPTQEVVFQHWLEQLRREGQYGLREFWLTGKPEIADYFHNLRLSANFGFRVTEAKITRWYHRYGFPMARFQGNWRTTNFLIQAWLASMVEYQRYTPKRAGSYGQSPQHD